MSAPLNPLPSDGSRWVVEGEIGLRVESISVTLSALQERLKEVGDVTRQDLNEELTYPQAELRLRVKTHELNPLLKWLRDQGQVTYERLSREEVSGQLLTQDVTITNAQKTLERLKVFMDKDSLSVDEVLRVERELSRLREVIETAIRSRELLRGRAALATLVVRINEAPKRLPSTPKAQFYLSGRPSLILGGVDAPDLGWGLSLFSPEDPASFHLDFDHFEATQRTLITMTGAAYSEFFGAGQNMFFNPHVGFKVGYAQDQGHHLALGATVGLELLRLKYAFVNLKGEGVGLIGRGEVDWLVLGGVDLAVVY